VVVSAKSPPPPPIVRVVTLTTPLVAFGKPVELLEFRQPALRDFFGVDVNDPFVTAAVLGARLSGLPPSTLEGMTDIGDIQSLIDAMQDFLRGSRSGPVSPKTSTPPAAGESDSPTSGALPSDS